MASRRQNAHGRLPAKHRRSTQSGSFRPTPLEQAANDGVSSRSPTLAEDVTSNAFPSTIPFEDDECPCYLLPPRDAELATAVSDSDARSNSSKQSALAEDLGALLGHGRYQLEALFCAACAHFVMLCHNLLHNVAAPHVDHWCRPPAEYANLTLAQWRSVSEPVDDRGQPRRCERFVPPLSVLAANRSTLPCDSLAYDVSAYGRTIVSDWGLVCERGWLLSASFVAYMWGAALGALAVGQLADKVGRRPAALVATFGLLCCGLGVCFAETFLAFAALRFGVSASVCGVQVTTYVLLFEATARARRTLYCVLATGVGLAFGPVCVYALAELSRSWVATQVILMLPTTLLGVAVLYTAEESPQWLLAVCDFQGAENVMLRAARLNQVDLQDALNDWRLRTAQAPPFSVPTFRKDLETRERGCCDAFRSRLLRPVVGVLCWCWFVALLSYYSHALMRATIGVVDLFSLNFVVIALQVPGSVATYLSMRRLGRKSTLWLLLCLLSFVAGMDAVVLSARGDRDHAVLFLYALTGALLNQLVMLLFAYSAEAFPTASRSVAVSGANFCGRLGAASAPALNRLLGVAGLGGAVPEMALLSLMAAITGLGALALPDTMSLTMLDRLEEEARATKRFLRPPPNLAKASTAGAN
ncbi:solute carrier family 22 member 7-like [Dermacentor variabilis]|uniref:solute carrier family 22 member 7-like n=1 Tax=Dermacentor variabilis TaxID=34621 RepID=UPI003F5B8071